MGNFHLLWRRGELHKKALQEHQSTNVIQNLGTVRVLAYMIQVDESKYNRRGIYQLSCPQNFQKSKPKILKKKLPCLRRFLMGVSSILLWEVADQLSGPTLAIRTNVKQQSSPYNMPLMHRGGGCQRHALPLLILQEAG
jgi:hypothetical protein